MLLEDGFAAFVDDHRRSDIPLDLVERIASRLREGARESQSRRGMARAGSLRHLRIGALGANPTHFLQASLHAPSGKSGHHPGPVQAESRIKSVPVRLPRPLLPTPCSGNP